MRSAQSTADGNTSKKIRDDSNASAARDDGSAVRVNEDGEIFNEGMLSFELISNCQLPTVNCKMLSCVRVRMVTQQLQGSRSSQSKCC